MNLPTWGELRRLYCTAKNIEVGKDGSLNENPWYEDMALRRYNYAPGADREECRLVFLKGVLQEKNSNTLRRKGRFIWCKNLRYEGKKKDGYRYISFTVDKGRKRFLVSEQDTLCVPSTTWVNNNRYFRTPHKIFSPFSTVFGYANTLKMMARDRGLDTETFTQRIEKDNPFSPGTLVSPRIGYFYPESLGDRQKDLATRDLTHPCGIILGRAILSANHVGKELYRVRFGNTTYEKVHPVQLEILNEV